MNNLTQMAAELATKTPDALAMSSIFAVARGTKDKDLVLEETQVRVELDVAATELVATRTAAAGGDQPREGSRDGLVLSSDWVFGVSGAPRLTTLEMPARPLARKLLPAAISAEVPEGRIGLRIDARKGYSHKEDELAQGRPVEITPFADIDPCFEAAGFTFNRCEVNTGIFEGEDGVLYARQTAFGYPHNGTVRVPVTGPLWTRVGDAWQAMAPEEAPAAVAALLRVLCMAAASILGQVAKPDLMAAVFASNAASAAVSVETVAYDELVHEDLPDDDALDPVEDDEKEQIKQLTFTAVQEEIIVPVAA